MDRGSRTNSPWSKIRGAFTLPPADPDANRNSVMKWYQKEEDYLQLMYDSCLELSREYMKLYTKMHKIQTKMRVPTIVMSSLSGVASFGANGFGDDAVRWISIAVGVVNIGIAIIQTYESYLKIADVVSKSLATSTSLKKLSDDIYCEIFIPVEDRDSTGITFLRDCFSRYQVILEQAPPLELLKFDRGLIGVRELRAKISSELAAAKKSQGGSGGSNALTPFALRKQGAGAGLRTPDLSIEIADSPSTSGAGAA